MPRRLLWWFWSTIDSPENIDLMYLVSFMILLIRKGQMREDCLPSRSDIIDFEARNLLQKNTRRIQDQGGVSSYWFYQLRFISFNRFFFFLTCSFLIHMSLSFQQMILKSGFCARLKLMKSIWDRQPFIQWHDPYSLIQDLIWIRRRRK